MSEARDFWSRRKARVAEEAEAEDAALEIRAIEAGQAEKTDDEILAELGLSDPEELGEGDDFSGFMAKAVPDRLRRRALRKLWLTNPVLANVDGLVDYGEDFTDAACVIENLQTAYQVGKGMTAHVEEMARQAELEAAEADKADGDTEADAEVDAPDTVEHDEEQLIADVSEDFSDDIALDDTVLTEVAANDVSADQEVGPAPRRRMRFHFDQPNREGANV